MNTGFHEFRPNIDKGGDLLVDLIPIREQPFSRGINAGWYGFATLLQSGVRCSPLLTNVLDPSLQVRGRDRFGSEGRILGGSCKGAMQFRNALAQGGDQSSINAVR